MLIEPELIRPELQIKEVPRGYRNESLEDKAGDKNIFRKTGKKQL